VVVTPPEVYVTLNVSPVVGCRDPFPLVCTANVLPVEAGRVCPEANVNWYVMAAVVLLLVCATCPPTVLY